MRRPLRLAAVPVVFVLVLTGCAKKVEAVPRPVPTALAPRAILNASLGFHLNTKGATKAAFREGAKDSLIDQGQLWEIRRKDRLVGTLQIATVKPEVDLADREAREQFTAPILVGARNDIRVLGQEVSVVENEGGLTTLIWFGKGLFLVMQVKDKLVGGAQLAQAVIEHQQSRSEWEPLSELYDPS